MGDRLDDSSTDLGNDILYQSNRAHANFLENAPLAIVLCAALELNGADRKVLSYAMAAFMAFRVLHVELGVLMKNSMGVGRIIGYYGTQGFFAGMRVWGLSLVRGWWGF